MFEHRFQRMKSTALLLDARCVVSVVLLALTAPTAAIGADGTDPPLAHHGEIVITRSDYEAELQSIRKDDRAAFMASARRNRELVERMLGTRELAAEAKKRKIDQDPTVKHRLALAEEKLLASILLVEVEEAAAREFAAQSAKFERAAREQYLVGKASYAKSFDEVKGEIMSEL